MILYGSGIRNMSSRLSTVLLLFLCAIPALGEGICETNSSWGTIAVLDLRGGSCDEFLARSDTSVQNHRLDWSSIGKRDSLDVFFRSSWLETSSDKVSNAAPKKTAMVAGLNLRLGSNWNMETSLGSTYQLSAEDGKSLPAATALRWKIGGHLGGFRVEAGLQDIGAGFSDPSDSSSWPPA